MVNEQGGCGQSDNLAASAAMVLDPRLAEIWQLVWVECDAECDDGNDNRNAVPLGVLGPLLRLAYLQGYADAVTETPETLWVELGVRDPALSGPTASERPPANGRARRGSSDR